jgi:hypothetical protein
MTVPAGIISFLPNRLDEACGALESELSSGVAGFLEQAIDSKSEMSNEVRIAKRRCTNTSCLGDVRWYRARLLVLKVRKVSW